MHSVWNRLNAVVSYAAIVLFVAVCFNAATHFALTESPVVNLGFVKLQQVSPPNRQFMVERSSELRRGDSGLFVTFDLNADFRPIWTWNTHELFVYIKVEYFSKDKKRHEAIIWDDIIKSKAASIVDMKSKNPDYFLVDLEKNLQNTRANLTVEWNTVPIAGLLLNNRHQGVVRFTIPAKLESLEVERTNRLERFTVNEN